jgi:predicted PurR-regulated permease PerM
MLSDDREVQKGLKAMADQPGPEAQTQESLVEAVDLAPRAPAQAVETAQAVEAAAEEDSRGDRSFGRPGPRFDRRSPFYIGMAAAAGVAVTYGLVQVLLTAREVLVLTGLALFLAIGLDPAVVWLTRHRVPRPAAVMLMIVVLVGIVAAFLALAIPPLVDQASQLIANLPHYSQQLQDHSSTLGRLNDRFHLQQKISAFAGGAAGPSLVNGVLGAGEVVLSALTSTVYVLVLTIYFLADMERVKTAFYRCVPQRRRARAILIGEDAVAKVGAYVLGNLFTSLIAGAGTVLWLEIFGVPYAILLGFFVAIMDLVPVVGSTVGGIVVALVAWTVSLPVAIATVGFYIAYRLFEDYLLVPKVMGKAVEVPGVVTVLAVAIGGALLGMIGALVAIPIAATVRVILREVVYPRLDEA